MMMPRFFLFGMIRVPMWEYYWGLTAAQVELLTIDTPIVVYKRDKNKARPGQKGYEVSADRAEQYYYEWKKRKKRREKSGRKLDLQHLLATGEQKELP